MKLEAQAVEAIMMDCLYREDEVVNCQPPEGHVMVDGIVARFAFHPGRLQQHKQTICLLLAELPIEFHKNTGGGWSFLNACFDKTGRQWGEHRNMEQLVVLGLATGLVEYCLPRELWSALPGGLPYFVVKL